jgi:ATP-binding cassette subfamily B (MDR/TAP) protein 9
MYMVIRSPVLGSCTLAIVPVVGVLNKIYGDWLGRNAKRVQNALAETTTCAHEALSCIKTVITLASEDHELEKYTSGIEKLYNLNIQQLIATAVYYMSVSTFLVNTCVQASLLLIGTIFVEQERLTADVLLAFMLYQRQLQEYMMLLLQSYSSLIKSSGAGDRVFFIMDRHPPPPGTGNSLVRSFDSETNEGTTNGTISFESVSFSYPSRPETLVLDNISLRIECGTVVALVGHSGCGSKSFVCCIVCLLFAFG